MTGRKLSLPDSAFLSEGAADGRLSAPSAERNFAPIRDCLAEYVPDSGLALEIASGTGQHIAALARAFPQLTWQPSDIDEDRLQSIAAWRAEAGAKNLLPPILLDAKKPWADGPENVALIYVVNLFHLISEADARAILTNMHNALKPEGQAFIYGPFKRHGHYQSTGDEAFDATLQGQDPSIGYKDVGWMRDCLAEIGLGFVAQHEMPANNLVLVAKRLSQS
ncbi:DUF938 domain-containing protein [Aliiroseovarius sp. YM-037]|uniref:DUF938 domain-containing protein n=1 Tax=Aliiroseovarius sp. YM-037 TaxID=3341728 RepID=UPI003A8109D0